MKYSCDRRRCTADETPHAVKHRVSPATGLSHFRRSPHQSSSGTVRYDFIAKAVSLAKVPSKSTFTTVLRRPDQGVGTPAGSRPSALSFAQNACGISASIVDTERSTSDSDLHPLRENTKRHVSYPCYQVLWYWWWWWRGRGGGCSHGMTVATALCPSGNCSAAEASEIPNSLHTASSFRVRSMISSLASS